MKELTLSEFNSLALYFPIHLAVFQKRFEDYGYNIKNIYQVGDDKKIYLDLVSGISNLALGDPIYTIGDHIGNIISVIVEKNPFILVSKNKQEYKSYKEIIDKKIGVYSFDTTNYSFGKKIFGSKNNIFSYDFDSLIEAIFNDNIDYALILPEQIKEGLFVNLKLIDFYPKLAFSALSYLDFIQESKLSTLSAPIRDTLVWIHNNHDDAYKIFSTMYPNIFNHAQAYEHYKKVWSNNGLFNESHLDQLELVWNSLDKREYKELKNKNILNIKLQNILYEISSRKFSRDYPKYFPRISKMVYQSLLNNEPISFVSFWGCGAKTMMTSMDEELISYTQKLIELCKNYGLNINFTFILADTHGFANGYNHQSILNYLGDVKKILSEKGFNTVFMSELWNKWNVSMGDIEMNIENIIDIPHKLIEQAAKNHVGKNTLEGAKKYLSMRTLEAPHLANEFKNSILCSYTDSSASEYLPDIPTLYLFTIGKYKSLVPWFE